jgi:hypothetical protein
MNMIFIGELWLPPLNPPPTYNNLFFTLGREALVVKGLLAVSIKRLIKDEIAGSWSINEIRFEIKTLISDSLDIGLKSSTISDNFLITLGGKVFIFRRFVADSIKRLLEWRLC